MTQPHILLNACHTVTGGGLVYLQSLLPHLAKDPTFKYTLLVQEPVVEKLNIPQNVQLQTLPPMGFKKLHKWEQFTLPKLCKKWGINLTWCNANFAPLMAPNPVITIHNNPTVTRSAKYPGWYWWLLVQMTRLSLWRGKAAFSVAAHILPTYTPWPWRKLRKKITIAPPAVTLPAAQIAPPRQTNRIVAVGDIYAQKQYSLLIQAIKVLKDEIENIQLHIVGRPLDEAEQTKLTKLVEELDLTQNITFTGGLPHAAVLDELRSAQVFVNASQAECFNMPVLEALACGTPAVVGDNAFQKEVAGDAALYINLTKGDVPSALATALFGVLHNPTIHGFLQRKGLDHAKHYSWQNTAQIMLNTFKTILKVKN